jgi:hypothetical protein
MPTLSDPRPRTDLHPVDRGLSLLDWAERDWDGFAGAVGTMFGDQWHDILANMVYDAARNRPPSLPPEVGEKMRKKLEAVAGERPVWVREWESRFEDD